MSTTHTEEGRQMVEEVNAMDVTGAYVMVGEYPNGEIEVAVAETLPINSETAGQKLQGDEYPFDVLDIPT